MNKVTLNYSGKKANIKNGEEGFLIIRGIFLKKTTKGILDEISFLPLHKELSDIQIKLSALQNIGAMWEKIGVIEVGEENRKKSKKNETSNNK